MSDDNTLPHPSGVIPHIVIRDNRAAEAMDFYKAAFGAEEIARMPEQNGARLMHAQLVINDGTIHLNDDFPEYMGGPAPEPTGVTLHLNVDDADTWFDRAVTAGAAATMPVSDQFWGDRYGQVTDPFGHRWAIGCPIKKG